MQATTHPAGKTPHRRRAATLARKKPRRVLAAVAIAGGALLMWLSPEEEIAGALLMAVGIAIEALGIWLEHRA